MSIVVVAALNRRHQMVTGIVYMPAHKYYVRWRAVWRVLWHVANSMPKQLLLACNCR